MGRIILPGSSVVYDNPKQVDQSTLIDPQTGKTWTIQPIDPLGRTSIRGQALTTPGPFSPQPGSFDPTPPQANPVVINQDPPVPGKGLPISVSGASGSTGNPAIDLTRKVVGTVAGTSVTISNPS